MEIKLPFDSNAPIHEEASIIIDAGQQEVFTFVADNYFENYPKWAPEIIEVEPLQAGAVTVGIKGKQVREEFNEKVESTFVVEEYQPYVKFALHGLEPAFKSVYLTESLNEEGKTKLTFSFELLDLDLFMRPFAKLIRSAIREGAESAVERIKELVTNRSECSGSDLRTSGSN